MANPSIRSKAYRQLHTAAWPDRGLSPVNKLVVLLIVVSVALVIVETEQTLWPQWGRVFSTMDKVVGVLMGIEYGARLWAMGEDPAYRGFFGRLRYMLTPTAIIDLLVIVPFFMGVVRSHVFLLRIIRVFRLMALARFGRFSVALTCLAEAIARRKHELSISMLVQCLALIVASTIMYFLEGAAQPHAFGSIPRSLWWGVMTLTAVGYGDVHPITVAGKVCCGITAWLGIALIAMPTGILAAAFSDAFQRRHTMTESNQTSEDTQSLERALSKSALEDVH